MNSAPYYCQVLVAGYLYDFSEYSLLCVIVGEAY